MKDFRTISAIKDDDDSTWKDSIFLTFDIDWAHDNVLNDTIDLVEAANVPATWFITHNTPILARLRANPKFELGIHPNFNFLLEGDNRNGDNAHEVLDRLLTIVPEATSVRSHSLTQSSRLLDLFKNKGLSHDANQFIPIQTGIKIRPWKLWNGMIRVMFNWEDDVHCMYGLGDYLSIYLNCTGLNVYNFHPNHVYLNTESMDQFDRIRPYMQNPQELIRHRSKGYGTRNRLSELLDSAKKR